MACLVALALSPHPSVAAMQPGDGASAEELYYEGSARYSAADYSGAIELFTRALALATKQGANPRVRSGLLFNLGRAHVRAYDLDGQEQHLRVAREIYKRFVNEAEASETPEQDVIDARAELQKLDAKIAEIEASKQAASEANDDRGKQATIEPVANPPPEQTVDEPRRNGKAVGGAILGVGVGLLAGGAGLLGYGSTFGGAAQRQVDEAMSMSDAWSPEDEEAGQAFIDVEKAKGRGLIGGGAAMATIGLAGVIGGAIILAKARKHANAAATNVRSTFVLGPWMSRETSGLVLHAQF